MNEIVKPHYPVSALPEDLRKELSLDDDITLIIRRNPKKKPMTGAEMKAIADALPPVDYDPDRVSKMRDEWDERIIR